MTQREQIRLDARISIIIFNDCRYNVAIRKQKYLFFSMLEQEVTLPMGFTCERCVLQLLRQAAEWTAAGGYTFWSCADIAIVDSPSKASILSLFYTVKGCIIIIYLHVEDVNFTNPALFNFGKNCGPSSNGPICIFLILEAR